MAEYDFSDPNYDFAGRAEILARALKQSQKLQDTPILGDMVGSSGGVKFASGPNWGSFLSRGAGAVDQQRAEAENTAMNSEQLRRYDELSRQINEPGGKVLKKTLGNVGPQEDGTALPGTVVEERVPLDYSNPDDLTADNARRMGLAGQLMKLNLPQAQKVAQDYLSKGAAFPETIAQLRMKQIEAGQQAAQRAVDKETADKRHEELLRTLAANKNSTAITIAGMKGSGSDGQDLKIITTTDADGNPIQQVVDMNALKAGDTFGKAPSAAAEKARHGANIGIKAIDDALAEMDKPGAKDAFGLVNAIPGASTVRQYTNPEGVPARAAVSNIGSLKLHDRSGASVTASEFPRLRPFIPLATDTDSVIRDKLNGLKNEYKVMQAEWKAQPSTTNNPKPAGGSSPKVVDFNSL